MPRLIKLGFEKSGFGYQLDLNWDDKAFAEGQIAFDISASRYRVDNPETMLEVLSVSVVVDPIKKEPPVLVIRAGGQEVAKISLESILNESQLIDRIHPSVYSLVFGGDPIIGCLIRSGLSATIGQIIECKNDSAGLLWFRPRMSAIVRCLRENLPTIGARMAFRAAKCIAVIGTA